MKALIKALLVFVLDPKIRAFLETNDPKALAQATAALKSVGVNPAWRVSVDPTL